MSGAGSSSDPVVAASATGVAINVRFGMAIRRSGDVSDRIVQTLNLIRRSYVGPLSLVTDDVLDKINTAPAGLFSWRSSEAEKTRTVFVFGFISPAPERTLIDGYLPTVNHNFGKYSADGLEGFVGSAIVTQKTLLDCINAMMYVYLIEVISEGKEAKEALQNRQAQTGNISECLQGNPENHRHVFLAWVLGQITFLLHSRLRSAEQIAALKSIVRTIGIFMGRTDLTQRVETLGKKVAKGVAGRGSIQDASTVSTETYTLLSKLQAKIKEIIKIMTPSALGGRREAYEELARQSVDVLLALNKAALALVKHHFHETFDTTSVQLAGDCSFGSVKLTPDQKYFEFLTSPNSENYIPFVVSKARMEEWKKLLSEERKISARMGTDGLNHEAFLKFQKKTLDYSQELAALGEVEMLFYSTGLAQILSFTHLSKISVLTREQEKEKSRLYDFLFNIAQQTVGRVSMEYARIFDYIDAKGARHHTCIDGALSAFDFARGAGRGDEEGRASYKVLLEKLVSLRDLFTLHVHNLIKFKNAYDQLGVLLPSLIANVTESVCKEKMRECLILIFQVIADLDEFTGVLKERSTHNIGILDPKRQKEVIRFLQAVGTADLDELQEMVSACLRQVSDVLKTHDWRDYASAIDSGLESLEDVKTVGHFLNGGYDLPPHGAGVLKEVSKELHHAADIADAKKARQKIENARLTQSLLGSASEVAALEDDAEAKADAVHVKTRLPGDPIQIDRIKRVLRECDRSLADEGLSGDDRTPFRSGTLEMLKKLGGRLSLPFCYGHSGSINPDPEAASSALALGYSEETYHK